MPPQDQDPSEDDSEPLDEPFLPPAEDDAGALARRERFSVRDLAAAVLARHNENTRAAYARDVEVFRSWAGQPTVNDACLWLVTRGAPAANRAVLAFREHMIQKRLSPRTINRRLSSLRLVVRMAHVIGVVETPWRLEVPNLPTVDYRDTSGTGTEGYRKLLAQLDKKPDKPAVRRDRVILTLCFILALRRKEIHGLNLEDVDFGRRRIRILGKGRTETEFVTMPQGVANVIASYLEYRGTDNGPLLLSYDPACKGDGRLSLRSISRLVKKLGAEAQVKGARPHGLRHAAITQALDNSGGDLRRVQRFSRHADPRTLIIYDDNRKDLGGEIAEGLDQQLNSEKREETDGDDEAGGTPPPKKPRTKPPEGGDLGW